MVSCRYLRRQIDSGAERRGVPHTPVEKAALDYVDELTSRPDLRLDMDFVPGDFDWTSADHPPEDSFYAWGPKVPEDFVTNFEVEAGAPATA